ncbi:hypothetical protein AAG906_032987 [Vitis piasezkii]
MTKPPKSEKSKKVSGLRPLQPIQEWACSAHEILQKVKLTACVTLLVLKTWKRFIQQILIIFNWLDLGKHRGHSIFLSSGPLCQRKGCHQDFHAYLVMGRYPILKKRCLKDEGKDSPKIAHILSMEIDDVVKQ